MRRKQYRQRNKHSNKHLSSQHPTAHQPTGFISYSSNLRKKQEQEMRVLQKIDYCFEQMPVKKNDNEMFLFMKQKGREEGKGEARCRGQREGARQEGRTGTMLNKSKQSPSGITNTPPPTPEPSQNYQKIDTSAVVIKGRLIYLKEQTDQTPSNDHFLSLLRQNNISAKQFLTGNQEQIKQRINQNESVKQNEIIKDYILRNMSEQSNGEVLVMDRFHEVKGQLFD